MSEKVQAELIRQTAEALNRMTAEAAAQGWTILVETDDSGEQIYVHVEKPDGTVKCQGRGVG